MKTIIVIECDEDNEVIQHLSVIRANLKRAIKKRRIFNMINPEDLSDLVISDNNCYGSHMATVHYEDVDTSEIPVANYTN